MSFPPADVDAESRRHLASLCRNKKCRQVVFSRERPSEFRPWEISSQVTGMAMTEVEAWTFAANLLDGGHPVDVIALQKPPGKLAYVLVIETTATWCGVYIKLELGGKGVFCRSFHRPLPKT